jgi:hypothetical protein
MEDFALHKDFPESPYFEELCCDATFSSDKCSGALEKKMW